MPGTLVPENVLKELHGLWDSLDHEGRAETGSGVLRSCVMTLVTLAEESEDPSSLGETIAALMPEHPARAVVIRLRDSREPSLSSRVYAQCWKPFGQRQQICCEQIEITASNADLADLPGLLLPLAVPDFPLIVWCRSPRLAGMPAFAAIARMAHKVVLDTCAFPDAAPALRVVAQVVRTGPAGDLAWTRLTRWRSMVSQVFENREYLERLPSVSNARVTWGGAYQTMAWYMAGWFADTLGDAGVTPRVEVAAEEGQDLIRVEVTGENLRLKMARQEERLVVTVNDLSHCTGLSRPTDYPLLREELRIVGRDAVFERALASATRLSEGL